MSRELHLENIARAQAEIEKNKTAVHTGKMRQRYHFMAEAGWLNDPNGLIFFRGKYHFFYQYNPYDSFWGAMHWGHAVSEDLLHWEYLPVALAPSENYDNHKEGGCFSGSAVAYDGKLWLMYTGTTNYGEGFVQTQCLAWSEDGIHFEKYEGNPVIEPPEWVDKSNFRDPKVWEHEGSFYLVCGAKQDNLAKALLYRSRDLLHWEFVNVLAESRGEFGYMFECPDFYPLGDKYVFMFSPMGAHERTSVYLVGDMDYETGKFIYTTMGEIDWGYDFYAPQSFVDNKGRRLIVGWANAWDWMPWWKDWGPTYKEGWCGAFATPREVKLLSDGTLQFVPVSEITSLREGEKTLFGVTVGEEPLSISGGDGISFDVEMAVDLKQTTASKIILKLRSNGERESLVIFDLEKGELTFDRNNSDGWSRGCSRSPLKLSGRDEMDIRILADQSSIEVYSCMYQNNHSCNVFAGDEQNINLVYAEGGEVAFKRISTWGLSATMK